MIDRVEVLLYVEVDYPFIALVQIVQGLAYCHVAAAVGTEPVAGVTKQRFIHLAQYLRCGLLDYTVYDRRDTQRTLTAVGLGNIDTSYGGWLISLLHYGRFYLIHVNRKIHVKLFHRHPVDAGRTMVAPDTHPGFPKVSRFYNLANQFHLLHFVLLVNIPWSVPAASDLGDYDSPDTVLSHFRTTKALLTAICTIYTLTPSVMAEHLLWAQLTPTHKLFIARAYTRWMGLSG